MGAKTEAEEPAANFQQLTRIAHWSVFSLNGAQQNIETL